MLNINLGLHNRKLYRNCVIETVAGRLNLVTPPSDAINIVGQNIADLLQDWEIDCGIHDEQGKFVKLDDNTWKEVVLTGPMAVWAYLIVFHAVVHRFNKVYYHDGKQLMLVAAHG